LHVAALACAVLVGCWRMCYARKLENLEERGRLLADRLAV
jgi:hypothetical protein